MSSQERAAARRAERVVQLRDDEELDFAIIGERLGMSAGAASAAYQRHKGGAPVHGKVLPPGPVARAYRAGASLARIATATKSTTHAVGRALQKAGEQTRSSESAHGVAPPSEVRAALEVLRGEVT